MVSEPNPRTPALYWAATIAAALAAAAFMFSQNDAFYQDYLGYFAPLTPSPSRHVAQLTIDFGNGSKRAFAGEVQAGMTVLSALRASEAAGKFQAVTDERGRLLAIAGLAASSSRQWRVYLNGAPIAELPGHIEIQPGDKITLRYE